MKKLFLTFVFAIVATLTAMAQQISVVSTTGATTLYRTLQEAIEGADPGSVIYLPGGGFPISDEVKITKKLTIIGIGHKSNNDNVDGVSTIGGNLFFNDGSSGSAVMGCYISGDIIIGEGDAHVKDLLIRYCSLYSICVKNNECTGIIIDQNYIRNTDYWHYWFNDFGNSDVTLKNNIIYGIANVNGGKIAYNLIISNTASNTIYTSLNNVNNTSIIGNILRMERIHSGNNCQTNNNFVIEGTWGDNPITINAKAEELFVNINNWTISPASDFHFKEAYSQYESKVGVYADGVDFNKQLAPVPYIVAKHVDEQTDASGKLNIKIRVKAGQ